VGVHPDVRQLLGLRYHSVSLTARASSHVEAAKRVRRGVASEKPLALRGPLPPGSAVAAPRIRGYYLDFRIKTEEPEWPPPWFPFPGFHRYMAVAQWGLGAFERYILEDDDIWLDAAKAAATHLVDRQERSGPLRGGWAEPQPYAHTFRTGSNWLSAMTQGQCASLLVRVGAATAIECFVEAAKEAVRPLAVPVARGGVQARLGDGIFLEEYPTDPPSYVLNGAIFALWGAYDTWRGADDDFAGGLFAEGTETLAAHVDRWDTGFWSRYDLFPHPIVNVASPSYHALHIDQLVALSSLRPLEPLAVAAARFARYATSPTSRVRALAQKGSFRLRVRKGG
jgi:heparosan-N-sulfate-glucuronate 5-epimerase